MTVTKKASHHSIVWHGRPTSELGKRPKSQINEKKRTPQLLHEQEPPQAEPLQQLHEAQGPMASACWLLVL